MEKLYVLYDAGCGLCTWAKRWLMRQPSLVHLTFIPAGSMLSERLFPGLGQPGEPPEELVVVSDEGGVYREGNAWIMCLFALEEYRDWANRLRTPTPPASGTPGLRATLSRTLADLALAVAGQRGRDRRDARSGKRPGLCQ